mmetsp:Transcript_36939/g.102614  ORF Transcript_36939/g.102614 Transcript_36939/m.102614 type:complete len:220 (-) Transcript_36939:1328-1987(-)
MQHDLAIPGHGAQFWLKYQSRKLSIGLGTPHQALRGHGTREGTLLVPALRLHRAQMGAPPTSLAPCGARAGGAPSAAAKEKLEKRPEKSRAVPARAGNSTGGNSAEGSGTSMEAAAAAIACAGKASPLMLLSRSGTGPKSKAWFPRPSGGAFEPCFISPSEPSSEGMGPNMDCDWLAVKSSSNASISLTLPSLSPGSRAEDATNENEPNATLAASCHAS